MPQTEEQVRVKWRPITSKARWKALEKRRDEIESKKRWQVISGAWTQKSGFIFTQEDKAMIKEWNEITDELIGYIPLREATGVL